MHKSLAKGHVLGDECWFYPLRVFGAMPRELCLGRELHLRGVPLEVGTRTTPMLRRIARQLHPVDRKHLAPDQPLPIAHREHGRNDRRDLVSQGADNVRDGGEVRT